jgi:transposase
MIAGSVSDYSNQALQTLVEALAIFSRPQHPEKSLEELRALLDQLLSGQARPPVAAPHIHNAERRLGEERAAELVVAYTSGKAATAVAADFEVGVSTVLRLVRRAGADVRKQAPSAEEIREAEHLYREGASLARITERLGIPKSTLRRTLIDAGVVMRAAKKPRRSAL